MTPPVVDVVAELVLVLVLPEPSAIDTSDVNPVR